MTISSSTEIIHIQFHKTPFGEFILGSCRNQLCLLDYRYRKMRHTIDKRIKQGLDAEYVETEDDLLILTKTQLQQYILGERTEFTLPLLLTGTDFQRKVWERLLTIPYGRTTTYSQLAEDLGQENAIRAVASANGANALAIVVPCHRVVAKNGDLAGYAGGIALKKRLLKLEQNLFAHK